MDENIYHIAGQIVQIHQKDQKVYFTLVEDLCIRTAHLLDKLLDFLCEEKMSGLYNRVCRRYLDAYPGCIKDYIETYRERWENEDKYSVEDF